MDSISKERRSWNMSRIRSKDTTPEKIVRSLLHHMGYRFRLHKNELPGKPDIVLPKYKTVLEVRGCYWHRHAGCKYAYIPKSNTEFWENKFQKNVERDRQNERKLKELGWKLMIVWECEIKNIDSLKHKLFKLKE
jgi:DNA mismatch endonuclease (patch repair protein)